MVGRCKRTHAKVQNTIERNTHPSEQYQTRDEVHGFDYAEETRDEFLDGWDKNSPREQDDCVKMMMQGKYQQEYQEQGNIEGSRHKQAASDINPTTTTEKTTPIMSIKANWMVRWERRGQENITCRIKACKKPTSKKSTGR